MASDARSPAHRSAIATAISKSVLSPGAAIGTRFALEPGRGRSAVPVLSPMLGAALSVAVLGAALTFGTSLGHLVNSPRQQGWNWDVLVGNPNDLNDRLVQDGHLLATNRYVGAYSAIAILASQDQGTATIDNVDGADPDRDRPTQGNRLPATATGTSASSRRPDRARHPDPRPAAPPGGPDRADLDATRVADTAHRGPHDRPLDR